MASVFLPQKRVNDMCVLPSRRKSRWGGGRYIYKKIINGGRGGVLKKKTERAYTF